MGKKCRQYSGEFKAKVALAAIQKDETTPQRQHDMGYIPYRLTAGRVIFQKYQCQQRERTSHR